MSTVEYEITPNKESVDVAAIIDSQNNNNLANMATSQSFFLSNRDAIERAAFVANDASNRNGSEILAVVERNGSEASVSIERSKGDIISSIDKTVGTIENSVNKISTDILLSQEKGNSDIKQIISETQSVVISSNKDIQLELCKVTEKLTVQASENIGKVELCVSDIKHHIELQIAEVISQLHLEALNNIKVLSSQMMECCCDLKEMMTATNHATQQLIRELENNRMKDALANANMELMMKKFSTSPSLNT
jgi:hypothetical protein